METEFFPCSVLFYDMHSCDGFGMLCSLFDTGNSYYKNAYGKRDISERTENQ